MSLQVEFGLLDDETFEDAARRIKTERDTYKSLCASQHEVITGYEEQENALVNALTRCLRYGDLLPELADEARAALEAAGVEL